MLLGLLWSKLKGKVVLNRKIMLVSLNLSLTFVLWRYVLYQESQMVLSKQRGCLWSLDFHKLREATFPGKCKICRR